VGIGGRSALFTRITTEAPVSCQLNIMWKSHLLESQVMSKAFKIEDYVLLAGAFIAFLLSVTLWFSGQREEGLYVGIWVPSILSFGVLVKLSVRGSN